MDEAWNTAEMPCVEVTDPDGNVFEFRFVTALENDGKAYVILNDIQADEQGDEKMIVIRVEKTVDGELEYVMPMDEQEVEAVFDRYALLSMRPQTSQPQLLH